MATITGYAVYNNPAHDLIHTIDVTYNFTPDGGTIGTRDLMEFNEDCIMYSFVGNIETTLASAGAATIALKLSGNDIIGATDFDDVVISNYNSWKIPLSLSEGTPNTGFHVLPQKITAGQVLQFVIADAALTAGKIKFKIAFGKY